MPTNFPTNPDSYTTKVDGVDNVMAAHVNDLQDAMMAVEDFALDLRDGWCYDTDTWTCVDATSFKIAGKDVCYRFPKGTKIKLVQSGSTKYFYVIATAYSTDTTVTITGGSDYTLASATISGQAYSYAAAPQGFPQCFNYTPTYRLGWSEVPAGIYRFVLTGSLCTYIINMTAGTSNSADARIGAPIVAASGMNYIGAWGLAYNNGTALAGGGRWLVLSGESYVRFYSDFASGGWTASGSKYVSAIISYLIQ